MNFLLLTAPLRFSASPPLSFNCLEEEYLLQLKDAGGRLQFVGKLGKEDAFTTFLLKLPQKPVLHRVEVPSE